MHRSSLATFAGLLFSALILLGVYWNGLHGGFLFDDGPSILFAKGVRMEELSFAALQEALTSGVSGPTQRPVAQLSFALNHYVSGFDPFAFKSTNLAIHAINGVLVFLLALRLISPHGSPQKIAAGAISMAWLLHPIQLLPVLHAVQRMTSLSALFLLSALLLHINARERGWSSHKAQLLIAWLFLWPLSALTKETGLLFPLFVLAWELILRGANQETDRFRQAFIATTSTILLGSTVYLLLPASNWLWAGYQFRDFSFVERLLTEGRVLWFYFSQIAFPRLAVFGLQHDDIAISTSLYSPWTTLPSILGLLALLWIGWISRKRLPLVSFGIFWFFIGHLMESTILPLEIAHEHRNYLPLFGILLPLFALLTQSLAKKGISQTLGIALAVSSITYFGLITALRAHAFGDSLRLTQMEVAHHPNSPRAQYEAGLALAALPAASNPGSPIYAFARKHYEESTRLDSVSKHGLVGLIHLNCQAGIPVDRPWIETLEERLEKSPFGPGDRTLMFNLKEMAISGAFCLGRDDIENLFDAAQNNRTIQPHTRAWLLSSRADYLWLGQRDLEAAKSALRESLTLMPGDASNRLKWAQLVYLSGDKEQTRQLLFELRDAALSTEERNTLRELLAEIGIAER